MTREEWLARLAWLAAYESNPTPLMDALLANPPAHDIVQSSSDDLA